MAEVQLYKGHGCKKCGLTGYSGRKGIFEIFLVTEEIQQLIFETVSGTELRIRAREMGMRTLREDGLRKAVAGVTTLEEIHAFKRLIEEGAVFNGRVSMTSEDAKAKSNASLKAVPGGSPENGAKKPSGSK